MFSKDEIVDGGDMSPINYKLYPPNWKEFSRHIRFDVAKGQCQCKGQCGLHVKSQGPRRCIELNGHSAKWARGKIVLTVAHLCNCLPVCAREDHVIAACQRCHLRIDSRMHVANSKATREKKSGPSKLGET